MGHLRYIGTSSKYSDGTSIEVETILNVKDVFSIQATRRCGKENPIRDKKGNDLEYDLKKDGHITIYKNDKTYHQFSFNSHKNIDEFMEQYRRILVDHRDSEQIYDILIKHSEEKPVHMIVTGDPICQ